MTVEELKLYLRVDGTEDDGLIGSLLTAATSYIQRTTGKTKVVVAGVESDIANDESYNICIKMMVAHWYENRGVEIAGNLTKISHSVDALVAHISLCGDYI